jgi:hypothetical protein
MKTIIRLLLLISCSLSVSAQPLETEWVTCVSQGINDDAFTTVTRLAGGDFVAGGFRRFNYYDGIIARITSSGDTIWTRIVGDLEDDEVSGIVPIDGDRLFVCGSTDAPTRQSCMLYMIMTADGQVDSAADLSGTDLGPALAAKPHLGGGVDVVGRLAVSASQYYFMHVSGEGDTVGVCRVAVPFADTWASPDLDAATDSGWIAAIHVNGGIRVVRFGDCGDTLWTRLIDSESSSQFVRVRRHLNGGYLLASHMQVFGHDYDAVLIRLTESGDTLWTRVFGGVQLDYISELTVLRSGQLLASGLMYDRNLVLMQSDGDTIWTGNGPCTVQQFLLANANQVLIAGNDYGACLALMTVSLTTQELPDFPEQFALSAYPNPFNPTTTIELTIAQTARTTVMVYDLLGRQVKTLQDGVLERGEHQFVFDASAQPSGLYFARVNSGGFVATRKLLLLK